MATPLGALWQRPLFWLLVAVLAASPQQALAKKKRSPPPPPARIEIPIESTLMRSGSVRFWVPVTIGGVGPIRALLDTGSTGLLVFNAALEGKSFPKIGTFVYGFDSNEVLSGTINQARVSVGGLKSDGPVRFGVVRKRKCAPKKPKCPIEMLKPEDYGIGGDGTAGEGFKAIIGLGLDRILIANPVMAAGGNSWIVSLPKPGVSGNGTLIVNPNAADLEGFRRYPLAREAKRLLGAFRASLPGCLKAAESGFTLCGQVGLDTGAPRVYAKVDKTPEIAAARTPQRFKLEIAEGDGKVDIALDETLHTGPLVYFVAVPKQKTPAINAGVLPYYSYQVLYDFDQNEIGLKRR